MRGITWLAGVLAIGAAGSAFAQACPCAGGTAIQQPTSVASLFGGKTVCASLPSTGEAWQEVHDGTTTAGGRLSDLKGTATPQEVVGAWSVVSEGSNTRVRYNYGTGGVYDFTVCTEASAVHFCGTTSATNARVINGGAG